MGQRLDALLPFQLQVNERQFTYLLSAIPDCRQRPSKQTSDVVCHVVKEDPLSVICKYAAKFNGWAQSSRMDCGF
jgi:hypothetical protein